MEILKSCIELCEKGKDTGNDGRGQKRFFEQWHTQSLKLACIVNKKQGVGIQKTLYLLEQVLVLCFCHFICAGR